MKRVDFRTCYGRIGVWPGDMGPHEANIVWGEAEKCRDGATFLEINPGQGRVTALLGTVAKNLGGKLYVAGDWAKTSLDDQRWLNRAVLVHGLRGTASIMSDFGHTAIKASLNGGGLDLILVNGDFARTDFLPTHPGTIVIQRHSAAQPARAEAILDQRPVLSVWKIIEELPPLQIKDGAI